jgi:hypothetical protein
MAIYFSKKILVNPSVESTLYVTQFCWVVIILYKTTRWSVFQFSALLRGIRHAHSISTAAAAMFRRAAIVLAKCGPPRRAPVPWLQPGLAQPPHENYGCTDIPVNNPSAATAAHNAPTLSY